MIIGSRLAVFVLILLSACHRDNLPRPSAATPESQPDIILITIDTLRADALGEGTPFLNQLARESVVFTNAHAHNVVTLPSHINILTGLYPYQHGVRDNAGYTLDPKFQTVAPLLKEKGYSTGAFIAAFPLDARFGLTPGFDVYDDKYPEGTGKLEFKVAERSAERVLAPAMQWWKSAPSPRFLWVHVYDPHAPYAPPAPFNSGDAYRGEVAYVDAMLARFIGPLVQPQTTVIVTGDHGEALGDHGELTHGLFAYEATLKVPLLVRDATAKPRTDPTAARHIDIMPTILKRAGIKRPPDRLGESLLQDRTASPSYFEALSASLNRGWAPLVGIIDKNYKYIDLPLPELYDLTADAAEIRNVVADQRRVTSQLRNMLAAAAPKHAGDRAVSPEQSAQLLSLGYVSGNATKKSYTTADDPKNLIEIDTMFHRMIELYQHGQRDTAVATAKEIVRRQPDMPVAREMLSFMLQEAEQSDAAIETLQQAVRRGTATDAVKRRLGLLLSESGRAKEAVEILAPFADRKDVDVLNAYGIALADVGRPEEAMTHFQRVLTVDPTNATAYQNLGIVALRMGRVEGAEQQLNEALAIDAQMPLALNTLGVVYARTGRTNEAIEAWRKAVALDPRLYDALFNLAMVSRDRSVLEQFVRTAPPTRYARELATAKQILRR